MPYSIKRLFKINKDVIEVLLLLEVPLTRYPKVEDLLCCTASCYEAFVFSLGDCFCPSFWDERRLGIRLRSARGLMGREGGKILFLTVTFSICSEMLNAI